MWSKNPKIKIINLVKSYEIRFGFDNNKKYWTLFIEKSFFGMKRNTKFFTDQCIRTFVQFTPLFYLFRHLCERMSILICYFSRYYCFYIRILISSRHVQEKGVKVHSCTVKLLFFYLGEILPYLKGQIIPSFEWTWCDMWQIHSKKEVNFVSICYGKR